MKNYQNPFKTFKKHEWAIWLGSLVLVTVSFMFPRERDYLTLIASLIGVTSLMLNAKGDPIGQVLTVVFSIFYSVISFKFRYYGEMITYLGMTAPIALAAAISWFRHPYKEGENEVKVAHVGAKKWAVLIILTAAVTAAFYFILKYFNTAKLAISTVSVATSFIAASLTLLRSPLYGLGYASNDIVLIIMWIMATVDDPSYLPMIVCFSVFFVNDCYGFINWRKIRQRQGETAPTQ